MFIHYANPDNPRARAPAVLTALFLTACAGVEEVRVPAELTSIEPALQVETIWDRGAGDGIERYGELRPVLVGDALYVTDGQGEVYALQVEDGRELWRQSLDVAVTTGLNGGESLLLLGTREGLAIALGRKDGRERWRRQLSSEVMAFSEIEDGVVVVRTIDSRLHGLSAASGEILWQVNRDTPALSLRGASRPIITGGRLVAGFANGELLALSLASGEVLWETAIALSEGRTELERMVDINGRIQVDGGIIYVVSFQGRIAAVTLSDGQILWSRELSSYTGLDLDESYVYVTGENSHVMALDRRTGAIMWAQKKLEYRRLTAPSVIGDYLVVGDFEGYLHWLSKSDGRFVARSQVGDEDILSAPLIAGRRVYALGKAGSVAALEVLPQPGDKAEDEPAESE